MQLSKLSLILKNLLKKKQFQSEVKSSKKSEVLEKLRSDFELRRGVEEKVGSVLNWTTVGEMRRDTLDEISREVIDLFDDWVNSLAF
jgi:hypothetical protein